jgi:hypothetical protein
VSQQPKQPQRQREGKQEFYLPRRRGLVRSALRTLASRQRLQGLRLWLLKARIRPDWDAELSYVLAGQGPEIPVHVICDVFVEDVEARTRLLPTNSARPVGVWAGSQRLIPTGKQSGLQTHTAATEGVSLCVRMKN